MDIPPPDPQKLLDHWMEWEKGETSPGDLLKQLKMGGMRTILEELAATAAGEADGAAAGETVGDILDGG